MQKSKVWSHKDHENTFCSIRMHHNLPFLMEKTVKNSHFLAKKCFFFGLRQAVADCPPFFEGAGYEKADCRDTKITQKKFTASVRTKICRFSRKKKRPQMALFWSHIDFLWLRTSS